MEQFYFKLIDVGETFKVRLLIKGDSDTPFVEYVPHYVKHNVSIRGHEPFVRFKPILKFLSFATVNNTPVYFRYGKKIYGNIVHKIMALSQTKDINDYDGVEFDVGVSRVDDEVLDYEVSNIVLFKDDTMKNIFESEESLESVAERLTVPKPQPIKKSIYKGEGMRHKFVQ